MRDCMLMRLCLCILLCPIYFYSLLILSSIEHQQENRMTHNKGRETKSGVDREREGEM